MVYSKEIAYRSHKQREYEWTRRLAFSFESSIEFEDGTLWGDKNRAGRKGQSFRFLTKNLGTKSEEIKLKDRVRFMREIAG